MHEVEAGPASAASAQPMTIRWVLLLGMGSAALIALAVSAQSYLSMIGHGHSFARIMAWQLCCWGAWALVAPVILREAAGLSDRSVSPRQVRRLAGLGVLLVAAHIVLAVQLTVWIQPNIPETFGFTDALVSQGFSLLAVDVLAYCALLLVGYATAVYHRARTLELRESRLAADLARAQLDALRLEIEPHFLFNTLNSIASLIRVRASDQALGMLLELSELMRLTLDGTRAQTTTLGAELAFIRRYIELQRVRFSDRLQVEYAVEPEAEACTVPTLLLQPIVENAFRHGIAKRAGACRLEVAAAVEAGVLHVQVRDNGAGLPDGFSLAAGARTGLRNVRDRLARLYDGGARLDLVPAGDAGTVAHIWLPAGGRSDHAMRAAG